ncbi:DUF397 domain-containing protein [Actinomadura sp. 9N407]|uniref:DUF397 domain-containing protein n=1 Tax=Actinomadura sp. 9N407 TaxID=3375154 RepID=UPI00378AD071
MIPLEPRETPRDRYVSGPWRKSTHSGDKSECVEVASFRSVQVGVRDSKNPDGPILVFDRAVWAAFIRRVR